MTVPGTIRLAGANGVTATIDPAAGGRLASLVIGGRERLVTTPDPAAPLPAINWGSFPMVPWVGRLRNGELEWRGRREVIPPNFRGHAIHGAAFDEPWTVVAVGDQVVELTRWLGPSPRWPFAAAVSQRIALLGDALDLRLAVRAGEPMPVAVGWHPWFRRTAGEPVAVVVPSTGVLETSSDLIPTGVVVPVDGPTDLGRPANLGDRRLDHAYVRVEGAATVTWPDLELRLDAAPLHAFVVHVTPAAVCIEPQTAWPDAIRLAGEGHATGLVALEAGETFEAASRWTWRRPQTSRPR